jgi:hypothetical protein
VFVYPDQSDYMIMNNRVTHVSGELTSSSTSKSIKLINCFDAYNGKDIFKVERNGVLLSVMRKITEQNN